MFYDIKSAAPHSKHLHENVYTFKLIITKQENIHILKITCFILTCKF